MGITATEWLNNVCKIDSSQYLNFKKWYLYTETLGRFEIDVNGISGIEMI